MRISLRVAGRAVPYFVSAQDLCDPRDVERDILDQCDVGGRLHDVSVDFGGEDIPLTSRHEARIVARMFAAEHNEYVYKNYGHSPREPARLRVAPTDEDAQDAHARYVAADYEQHSDLGEPSFGPSHSLYTNW